MLSPYSDGERDALIADFANHQRCRISGKVAASTFLPVTIRGEMSGRTMRGGADFDN
jgi:zinc protease